MFSYDACSIFFMSFPSLRKTFGWKSLTINLVCYLLFVFPLTGLAVYSRANERLLCGVNESTPRKVTIFAVFYCFHVEDVKLHNCIFHGPPLEGGLPKGEQSGRGSGLIWSLKDST